jgi:hypothetical protein
MFCVFVCSSSDAFYVSGRISSNVGQFEAPCGVLTTLASSSCESHQLTFLRLHCLWWGSYLLCNSTLLLALRCVSLLYSGGLLEWCFLCFCEDFQQSVAIWSSLLCRDATGKFLLCIVSIDVLALSWRHWRVLIMYRVNWRLLGYFACGEGPIHAVLQKADSETSERTPDFGAILINPGQFEAAMLWRRWQVVDVTASKVGFQNP